MDDLPAWDETGELAWVRLELDLLAFAQQSPEDRARFEDFVRRERRLLRLDEVTA